MQAKITLPDVGTENVIVFGANVEERGIRKRRWVYVQSANSVFLNKYRATLELENKEIAIELSKFLELLTIGNHIALQMLFAQEGDVLYTHAVFRKVIAIKKGFLTKRCKYGFTAEAVLQLKRLNKLRMAKKWQNENIDSKSILDFCYVVMEDFKIMPLEGFQSAPILEVFAEEVLKRSGVARIPLAKNLYNLYSDVKHAEKLKGVVEDKHTSTTLTISDIPHGTYHIAMVYFDEEAFHQYLETKNDLNAWLKEKENPLTIKDLNYALRLLRIGRDIAVAGEISMTYPETSLTSKLMESEDVFKLGIYVGTVLQSVESSFANCSLPVEYKQTPYLRVVNHQIRVSLEQERKQPKYY